MSRFINNPLYLPLQRNEREIRGVRDNVNNDMIIIQNVKPQAPITPSGMPLDFSTDREVDNLEKNILLMERIKRKAKEEISGGCCGGCSSCNKFVGMGLGRPIDIPQNHFNRNVVVDSRFKTDPLTFKNNSQLGLEDNRPLRQIVYPNQM